MSEQNYLNLLNKILVNGEMRADRTGVGTRSLFGEQIVYDLDGGFPLLTTKKVHWDSIVHELLWFIRGDTNIQYLKERGVRIWDEWADESGNLGPVYGEQWRSWGMHTGEPVDQLRDVIESIQASPHSRRHIVTAWNPSFLPEEGLPPFSNPSLGKQALPPCHCLFQFYVRGGSKLDLQLYQRSADIFLGVPFNIASYALLLSLVAHVTGLEPGKFIHTFGDVHLYLNHEKQAKEQLGRAPRELPTLRLNQSISNIDDFEYPDIKVDGYNPHPVIKAKVAV